MYRIALYLLGFVLLNIPYVETVLGHSAHRFIYMLYLSAMPLVILFGILSHNRRQ